MQPPADDATARSWPRRVLGFAAGVAAVWVPLQIYAATGTGWTLAVAGAGLWVVLVLAIRGFSAPAWGLLAGLVSSVACIAIIWTQGAGCAYEDAAGRIVEACGADRPR